MPSTMKDELPIKIKNWFSLRAFKHVSLHEKFKPDPDKHQGYEVVYEAIFTPDSTDLMQIEIWLTKDGKIAVGIETWARVLSKFGKDFNTKRFIAGHEPEKVDLDFLFKLLTLISNGSVLIEKRGWSILGLNFFNICITDSDFKLLEGYGQIAHHFIKRKQSFPHSSNFFRFKAWK